MCEAYSKCKYCLTNRDVCGEMHDFAEDCSGFRCSRPQEICSVSECYSLEEYRDTLLPQRYKNVIERLPLGKCYFDID